jgi:hypothetical protein
VLLPNPLISIASFLELIGKEVRILPAIGRAVEELQHPDQEEIEDLLINKESQTNTDFAEVPKLEPSNIYRQVVPISRIENHFYRFFVDGSIRTYFIGTGIDGTCLFPFVMAQIGAIV